MGIEFNTWFPNSKHGNKTLNVMDFGAYGDGAAHSMADLGYADLAAAQVDYPSATGMGDTADWCAITECVKHCFSHETSPGVWVLNHSEGYLNTAMLIPTGRYLTRKPIDLVSISDGYITGQGFSQIYNETAGSKCIAGNGLQNCRFEQLAFQCIGGEDSVGFDLDAVGPPAMVNTTGNLFINCAFVSPGGVGLYIGLTQMSSEAIFIRCLMSYCKYGCVIGNWNALNYQFLGCGGINNEVNWIRVNTGGNVVVQNASLAENGTQRGSSGAGGTGVGDVEWGFDMLLAGGCAVIGTRTESIRFVRPGNSTVLIGCTQANSGNDVVFCDGGAVLINCEAIMSRLCGSGQYTLDSCIWNLATVYITAIGPGASNGAGGNLIRITHDVHPNVGREWFLNGDNVRIADVVSANTGQTGGAANTNGNWTINKLTATTCDLVGSTYVADTYTSTVAGSITYYGFICPGPDFHKHDILHPSAASTFVAGKWTLNHPERQNLTETKRKTYDLQGYDAGKVFDNLNAIGEVIINLPMAEGQDRGSVFRFVVLTAQTLKIVAYNVGGLAPPQKSDRIFRAGGYHIPPDGWGTEISSNVVGSTLELFVADGDQSDMGNYDWATGQFIRAHRWVVRAETGTWTISGVPAVP